jgi:hypothetical protein
MTSLDPEAAMAAMFRSLVSPTCERVDPDSEDWHVCGEPSVGWSEDDGAGLCADHVDDKDDCGKRLTTAVLELVEELRTARAARSADRTHPDIAAALGPGQRIHPDVASALATAMGDAGEGLEIERAAAHKVGEDDEVGELASDDTLRQVLDLGTQLLDLGAPMPRICVGTTGSVDLHWRAPPSCELLLNVDSQGLVHFYGDEMHNVEATKVEGAFGATPGPIGGEWTPARVAGWLRDHWPRATP